MTGSSGPPSKRAATDAWERQRVLGRTTVGWSVLSIVGGAVSIKRAGAGRTRVAGEWWRSFGQQHLGWGLVDLGIVAAVSVRQTRAMRRVPDPYARDVLERERRRLRIVLGVNAGLDAGYCVVGALMWRRSVRPKAAGAGAAILIQGAFLMLHDSYHAIRSSAGSA